ncbi:MULTISPECIES: extensin-like protein [unclassified Corallococcus]|uniref:extensin-like protein n=1 Tax=unclassified Corallococcus TaxID=2685029 RepID=UPI001F5DA2C0|nr:MULTISPECIES: extensin-like protein [unclassified Corallococcus]WAS87541.1 extensin-like protein [Corallococcus sp. NCRR]
MKKAFEQNVSRAKPRLRLGALTGALDPADPTGTAATPEPTAPEAPAPVAESPDLSSEVRSRIERRAGPRPTAAEAMEAALNAPPRHAAPPPAAQGLPAVTAPSFSPVSHALSALVSPEAARVEEEAPPEPWMDADSQATASDWNVAQESAPEESVWDADAVPPVSHREVAEAVAASAWNVSVAQQRESVVEAFGREPLGAEPTPTHVEPPPPAAAHWDALTARPAAATHVDAMRVAPLAHSATHAEAAAPVTFASPPPPPAMAQAEAPRGMPATFAGPPPGVQFDGRMGVQALRMPSEAEPMTTYAAVQASTVTTTETVARQEAAPAPVEVQTPAPPREDDSESRREKLKARLKAVRENPRPEPLPATVAEAGQRAVERITHLQAELTKVKAANLTLTQDLEVARRQAEKATEEARLRMDEARRLSAEMEGRVKLLADLERELASLEGERDEALLSLQESRQALQAAAKEHEALEQVVTKGKLALADSLAEEERLAVELEGAKDESASLRRAVETLQGERDVLAQQVASLTAERAELLEARKALESVHRALSQATVR